MALTLAAVATLQAEDVQDRVRVASAIEQAVRERVDAAGTVRVDSLRWYVEDRAEITAAAPDMGARFERPARFRLLSGSRQVGYAVATVTAAVPHARIRNPVPRGAVFTAEDVEDVIGSPGVVAIERFLAAGDVIGSIAGRSCAAGETATHGIVRVPPAVQSGERVVAIARIDGAEVRGVATALQSGQIGDVITLVNPETRRRIRARISGKAEVEVRYGQ